MTADICTAAEAEAADRWGTFAFTDTRQGAFESDAFIAGAVWAAARVTPTREQIALTVAQFFGSGDTPEDVADAILKLFNK